MPWQRIVVTEPIRDFFDHFTDLSAANLAYSTVYVTEMMEHLSLASGSSVPQDYGMAFTTGQPLCRLTIVVRCRLDEILATVIPQIEHEMMCGACWHVLSLNTFILLTHSGRSLVHVVRPHRTTFSLPFADSPLPGA